MNPSVLILSLCFFGVSYSGVPDPCPTTSYEYHGDFNRCIRFASKPLSFWDALAACKSERAQLLAIHNAFFNSFISSFVKNYQPGATPWIGAYRNSSNGEFYWTEGTDADYLKWNAYNPHPGDHAAVFDGIGWSSDQANSRHPFICYTKPAYLPCNTTGRY